MVKVSVTVMITYQFSMVKYAENWDYLEKFWYRKKVTYK